jgi:replicative DNA helicase
MNQTFGNFEEGYNLVAARPSVGKTSFVLQLMVYWWQCGYKCAFNCLDMACSQIIKRPTMNLAQLNLTRANRGMLTEEEFKRLKQAAMTIKKWDDDGIIKFREDYDVDKFIAWCKLQKSMGKLDVVVIDYIQQMTIRGVEGNENAKLTEISKRLKNFANTNKMPFIILSQLSRDNVKDKNGNLVSVDNCKDEYIEPYIDALKRINPRQVMIYTLDREWPTEGLEKADHETMDAIAEKIRKAGFDTSVSY